METIRLENLSVGYRSGHALATDISAAVDGGGLTCLLGPNGAGKSTLLKTISGFLRPLAGRVWLGKRALSELSNRDISRLVSIVLTEKLDVQNLTVEEIVGLGRSPYTGFWGRLGAEDRRIVGESIALTGITPLRRRLIQTLSDGERQKTMIAKALAQQTPIILLDEPTAFLDYQSKVDTFRLLHHLAREMGKTVLLSTHDLELAMRLTDTVWLMEQGGISIGTPQEMLRQGRIRLFADEETTTV